MEFDRARANMVDSQLRTTKVTDPAVLDAFSRVKRERFLGEGAQALAYLDEDVPLGEGRFVMEPMVMARLLQAARPSVDDVALEVGAGSGYASAILARLVGTVVALESDRKLAQRASDLLSEEEADNAVVVQGDLVAGWPEQAPFDLIFIGGAVAEVPASLIEQLSPGGRLVTVVRGARGLGQATLMERTPSGIATRRLFDAATPWLPGFEPRPSFVF